MNRSQFRVIAGPYRNAKRYAESKGWTPDEYVIVTRAHQLCGLDPARIATIITVHMNALSARINAEIHEELRTLKALWPIPMLAAA